MKQKIIIKLLIIIAIAIATLAIGSLKNEVYADVPTGDLKIVVNFEDGVKQTDKDCLETLEINFKCDGSNPNYDEDFEARNGVSIDDETKTIIIPKDKLEKDETNGKYIVLLRGMPNGNYSINSIFAQIAQSFESKYIATCTSSSQSFTMEDLLIMNIETEVSVRCKHNYYLYYSDLSNENPSVKFQFEWGYDTPFKFNYSKDSDGNNVYTFDKDGTIEDIEVKSKERTIVKSMPAINSGAYRIKADVTYGGKFLSYSRGIPSNSTSDQTHFNTSWDSDPFPIDGDRWYYLEYVKTQKVAQITKTNQKGEKCNAKFKILDKNFSKYREFDYYESYEFDGKTYSNVYVMKDELSDDGEEISTVNGEVNIIYPVITCNTEGKFNLSSYDIYEIDADENLLFDSHMSVCNIESNNQIGDGISNYINSSSLYKSKYNGEDFGVGINNSSINNNPAEFDYNKLTNNFNEISESIDEISISDFIKPSVTKIVLDSEGNIDTSCEDEFEFSLYKRSAGGEYILMDTIKVKANETKYFNVQMLDPQETNFYSPESNYNCFIVEKKSKYYTLESITAEKMLDETIPGQEYILSEEEIPKFGTDIYEKCYNYTSNEEQYINAIFTDKTACIDIFGEKIWNDNNNEGGTRPGFITIILRRANETIKSVIVKADNEGKWKYKFENLPKYENGEEIKYTIEEEAVEMYKTEIDNYNIINTLQAKEITVKKVWNDENNKAKKRPSTSKVQLYGNNQIVGEAIILNEENNWAYTWKYLPLKTKEDKLIKYTVKEINVDSNYTAEISGDEEKGFIITNTFVEKKEEEIKKEEPQNQEKPVQTGDVIIKFVFGILIIAIIGLLLSKVEIRRAN